MATVQTRYRCNVCGEIHEDVRKCGALTVSAVYQCSVCNAVFNYEDDAEAHCGEHSDHVPDVPTHAELEAHGQQVLPL